MIKYNIKTSKFKLFIFLLSIFYIIFFFCVILSFPTLLNITKITEYSYKLKGILVSHIEVSSTILIISLINFAYCTRPEQINTITDIPTQWNMYKNRIEQLSNNFDKNSSEFKDKSNQFVENIFTKQKELELMRIQANCNYQIYSARLDICYKKVLTSTADLKYGLYTICTHSDLSECKEFMDKYEQYKTNLHKLKDVSYKI